YVTKREALTKQATLLESGTWYRGKAHDLADKNREVSRLDYEFARRSDQVGLETSTPVLNVLGLGGIARAATTQTAGKVAKGVTAGKRIVPNNNNFDILHQTGKLEKDINGFYRTSDLGTHTSMSELMQSGALPGTQGVTLTDRTVRFGNVYDLGKLDGRKIEFSLTTERVDGKLVKRLYSGDDYTSPVPKDSRLIGHVHPNETSTQMWPSPEDMNVVNARYFRELQVNPGAQARPTRIFWGSGNTDNTIFYPGFGKVPVNKGCQK
ncbi:hypothetical protein, partial [Halioxenophilus aromaticivorans]